MYDSTDTTVQFKLYFADDTTANLSINGIDESKIPATLKAGVQAFNNDPSEYSNLMVSKAGAAWLGITGVTITTKERHYIF